MNDNAHSDTKCFRVLNMYTRLENGEIINKKDEAAHFGVTARSIQRDIEIIRFFVSQCDDDKFVIYDTKMKGYVMKNAVFRQ